MNPLPPERAALEETEATLVDMPAIDERRIAPLRSFLEMGGAAAEGLLQVSLRRRFPLDPSIAAQPWERTAP